MAVREPIYAALAALVFNDSRIQAVFVTTGRWLVHHEQLPAGNASCPALYLVQHPGEEWQRPGKGIDPKRTLKSHFVMYFYTGGSATYRDPLPATLCNNGLDALDDVLTNPVNPQNTQTLGGLVEHVYIEGPIRVAEGLLQEFSIVEIPITILLP